MNEKNEKQQISEEKNDNQNIPTEGTGFKNVLLSALAGLFGIQSEKNRERDFQEGNPTDFIMIGIISVVVLIIIVVTVVNIVLSNAT